MPKINILVEGQTEETFVRDVLAPHLLALDAGTYPNAIIAQTKRVYDGRVFRGGITRYQLFREQMLRLLGDHGAVVSTTLIDLYHLPSDFPGKSTSHGMPFRECVAHLENALRDDIRHDNFVPYLSTHEFEALVLTDPSVLCEVTGATIQQRGDLVNDIRGFGTPEEIDGTRPPSYRILDNLPQYDKTRHGPISANRLGIDRIRSSCEHFSSWVHELERRCGL